jgi:hypothetical protein
MADTVLESFLIKLGYQVDQASQKSFTTAISEGVKGITAFAAALTAMAIGVEEAVRRTAFQMARLEASAQLSNKPADQLKAFGSSLAAVGGNYQEAIDQQVKFTQALNNSPWMKGYAQTVIGQHSLDIKGVTERYHELYVQFGPGSQQLRIFADQMSEVGVTIGNNQILAAKNWDQYQRIQKQMEQEAVTFQKRWDVADKNSMRLQLEFTALGNTIDNYYKTAMGGVIGYLADGTKYVEDWLVAHERIFNDWMDELEKNIKVGDWEAVGKQIGEVIGKGVKYFFEHVWDWLGVGVKAGIDIAKGIVEGLYKEEGALGAAGTVIGGVIAAGVSVALVGGLSRSIFRFFTGGGGAGAGAGAGGAAAGGLLGFVRRLWPVAAAGIGLGILKDTGVVGGKNWKVWDPAWGPPPPGWDGGVAGQRAPGDEPDFIDKIGDWLHEHFSGKRPSGQHGGIIPINAHPGEMLLPQNLSSGIQSFFGNNNWSDSMDDLSHWLTGDTTFSPIMDFADQAYDKLVDVFEEALRRVWPDAGEGGGTGNQPGHAGGGGGPGGGAGAGGARGGGSRSSTNEPLTAPPEEPPGTPSAYRKQQREQMFAEYDKWTDVQKRTLSLVMGRESKDALESLANRTIFEKGTAMNPHGTLWEGLSGRFYSTFRQAQADAMRGAGSVAVADRMAASVRAGSDVLGGRTDQGMWTDPGHRWMHAPGAAPGTQINALGIARRLAHIRGEWYSDKESVSLARRDADLKAQRDYDAAHGGASGSGSTMGQIQAAIGDSIAEGVDQALGLRAGAGTLADAVGGTTPKQILARVAGHIQDYAGKTIALASGSNPNAGFDESQMSAVKETMERLHAVGAHIVLLGVGKGVKDADKINARLASIASGMGDPFTGGLEGTDRRGGVVHPDDYRKTVEQIRRAGSQMSSGSWGSDFYRRLTTHYATGGALSGSVDNSHNTVVINGVSNEHDIQRQLARTSGNRYAAYSMRNGRTYTT